MSQFKHVCSLCSTVNKILAHVTLNYFSFHFIHKKKKKHPTIPEKELKTGIYLKLQPIFRYNCFVFIMFTE